MVIAATRCGADQVVVLGDDPEPAVDRRRCVVRTADARHVLDADVRDLVPAQGPSELGRPDSARPDLGDRESHAAPHRDERAPQQQHPEEQRQDRDREPDDRHRHGHDRGHDQEAKPADRSQDQVDEDLHRRAREADHVERPDVRLDGGGGRAPLADRGPQDARPDDREQRSESEHGQIRALADASCTDPQDRETATQERQPEPDRDSSVARPAPSDRSAADASHITSAALGRCLPHSMSRLSRRRQRAGRVTAPERRSRHGPGPVRRAAA
jgi:hypothetical protein